MNKQRIQIPPPKITPAAEQSALTGVVVPANRAPAAPPPPVAIVPPPVRVSSMKVTDLGIEYVNPTISLKDYIYDPAKKGEMVKELRPARAYVVHGTIVIEEMRLTLPLTGALIRS